MTPTKSTKPTARKPRAKASSRAIEQEIIDVEAQEDDEVRLPVLRESQVPATLTIGELAERRGQVLELMQSVLSKGIDGDFAPIPGCGPKPSLLQPGAQKIARFFNLSVARMERTMLECVDGKYIAGYQCAINGPDDRVWGEAEAFAAETEKTFAQLAKQTGGGAAMLNGLCARAQKRAYVRAVLQATGASDLFAAGEAVGADLLNETQRAIYVAIYERVLPRRADMARRNATKIKQSKWEQNLGAALDDAADVLGWSTETLANAFDRLSAAGATEATVAEVFA